MELSNYESYIHLSRYARWLPKQKRRETWEETVSRYVQHFETQYPDLFPADLIYKAIHSLEVMPSMRALMTAGKALDRDNISGFNCSYVAIDHPRAFDEILYILMCGTGVGFSVERQSIADLPVVNEDMYDVETVITVHDSRIGWATAFRQLLALLWAGQVPRWDTSKVRPKGTPLKTFGGRASGPEPLEELFQFCVNTFRDAAGRKLNSLECHDIVCKIADIVIVGGVRRSALISLSNLSDLRMANAKNGQWWDAEPQRKLANNSAAYTEKPDMETFMREWLTLVESKSGERGIMNRVGMQKKSDNGRRNPNYPFGTNPCGEIILRSAGVCNLTEGVVRPSDTLDDLLRKVEIATIMGTFQCLMTKFRYIRNIWKKNAEEERLLGVSLTGIMDHPVLSQVNEQAAEWLRTLKAHALEVNEKWAAKLGIECSVAVTTVKPSGCATLDTEIRTEQGDFTLEQVFDYYGHKSSSFEDLQDSWLNLGPNTDPLCVFDENDDLQEISGLYVNGVKPVYAITFEDGNTVKLTGNHKLQTIDGRWVRVDELTVNDEILNYEPTEI